MALPGDLGLVEREEAEAERLLIEVRVQAREAQLGGAGLYCPFWSARKGRREEPFEYSDLASWTKKYEYVPVFGVPDEPWKIGAFWEEAYFDSAKYVIEGVLKRELMALVHGVAGVFLFRHYLEIALKFIRR